MQRRELKSNECRIGDYIIGKSIGEGTFGKVRIGYHEPTGEKVMNSNLTLIYRWLAKFSKSQRWWTMLTSKE